MITFSVPRPENYSRQDWLCALQAILPSAQEYTGEKPPPPPGTGSRECLDHWDDPAHAIWVIVGRRICRADWRCESPESAIGCLFESECFVVPRPSLALGQSISRFLRRLGLVHGSLRESEREQIREMGWTDEEIRSEMACEERP